MHVEGEDDAHDERARYVWCLECIARMSEGQRAQREEHAQPLRAVDEEPPRAPGPGADARGVL